MKKIFIFSVTITIFLICIVTYNRFYINEPWYIINYQEYEVMMNDTLWSIARNVSLKNIKDNRIDIREVIYTIMAMNNIDAKIYIGQIIEVPIYILIDNVSHLPAIERGQE